MQSSLEFKLNSCKRKNVEILLFLSTLRKEKEYPVTEFESNLRNVQEKIEKLLGVNTLKDHQDGSCSLILDEFYPLLVNFERQLQEMKSKGTLMRFLTSNRLRRELEKSNTIIADRFEKLITAIIIANPGETASLLKKSLAELSKNRSNSVLEPVAAPAAKGTIGGARGATLKPHTSATSLTTGDRNKTGTVGSQLSLIENEEARKFWQDSFGVEFQVNSKAFLSAFTGFLPHSVSDLECTLLLHVLDNSNTGFVNVYKFSEFMKGFGPLKEAVKNCKRIFCEPWFHGFLSGEEAIRLLEDQDVGTFLVRFSRSKPGSFALAFVEPNSAVVLQVEISAAEGGNGGFTVKEQNNERFFRTLHELLDYYKQYFVKPFSSDVMSAPWFHGDLNYNEAVDVLTGQELGTFLVRISSQPGSFAASFVTVEGVKHALIKRVADGYFEPSSNVVFGTLTEFVEGHKEIFIHPFTNTTHEIVALVNKLREEFQRADEQELIQEQLKQENANANRIAQLSLADHLPSGPPPHPPVTPSTTAEKPGAGSERKPSKYAGQDIILGDDGLEIKAGTIDRLIERLFMDAGVNENTKIFLLTYRKFLSPPQLLAYIIRAYNALDPRASATATKVKRLRICNFLKNWLEKYYHDFENEVQMIETYREFVTTAVLQNEGERLSTQLSGLLQRQLNGGGRSMIITITKDPPVPILPKTENFAIVDLDPVEVARQMTLIEFDIYAAIQPKECLNMTWTKPELKHSHSPNIMRSIARFNQVSMFVMTSLVSELDSRKRIALFEHFVKIAVALRELKNFNGCLEIISGMHHSAVDRLKKTIEAISDKQKKALLDLKAILSSDKSWSVYRELLHQTSTPLIPYLGMYLSDLVFIETGNSDWWEGDKESKLINFKKCRFIAKSITEITSYQQMPYNLWPVQSIRQFLLNLPFIDDNKAFALSLQCEPREPKPN